MKALEKNNNKLNFNCYSFNETIIMQWSYEFIIEVHSEIQYSGRNDSKFWLRIRMYILCGLQSPWRFSGYQPAYTINYYDSRCTHNITLIITIIIVHYAYTLVEQHRLDRVVHSSGFLRCFDVFRMSEHGASADLRTRGVIRRR